MATNDKERQERELTPAQRRRRMEARKKRRKKQRRKKQIIRILVILAMIAVVALLVFGIYTLVTKLSGGGSKKIKPQGDTPVVYIDPGHGGEDVGMGSEPSLEKDITLEICSKLKVMLESQGYQVVMTREDDARVSKEERVSAANASEADLLVSIHCGFSDDSSITGSVSYYKSSDKESKTLCKNIQEAIVKESSTKDGGSTEGDFVILSGTNMPAVLLEVGYLSNTVEAENLADDSYQNNVAKGIAKGIILSLEESQ